MKPIVIAFSHCSRRESLKRTYMLKEYAQDEKQSFWLLILLFCTIVILHGLKVRANDLSDQKQVVEVSATSVTTTINN